jgi:hypothetical protein
VFTVAFAFENNTISSFSSNGAPVYHIKTGLVEKGKRTVITASTDGSVKCFTTNGILLWKADTEGGFLFDLCVSDIDNDGLDEVMVASGNGALYTFDSNGSLLWKFDKTPPLYQVTVSHDKSGNPTIFTGGVEQKLYALSSEGELINSITTTNCIRHIRAGKTGDTNSDFIAFATASSGLFGMLSLYKLDPVSMTIKWGKDRLGSSVHNSGSRFFSMLTKDVNNDGADEILLTGGWGESGIIYAFNQLDGNLLYSKSDKKVPDVAYRMNLLKSVSLPNDNFIIGHFGNIFIVYELDGKVRELVISKISFADSYFDPVLKTLFLGSSVSGGDGVYAVKLDEPDWQSKIKNMLPIGKLARIIENMNVVSKQIDAFVAPDYQPKPSNAVVIASKPDGVELNNLSFTREITYSQVISDTSELWCKETDPRRSYDMSADEIVAKAMQNETNKQYFFIWAGHGEAMHFPLSTFERVMKAAPNYLKGFIFAEMEGISPNMQDVVNQIILPLADLCKTHKKLMVFRNKNIFWNGTCYMPFWRNVLLNDKYKDVIIPGLEETNCRSHELSLMGRIGLWKTHSFDHWMGRMTTDNANFDRMFEWGAQEIFSHHFRNLVANASSGSDFFYNSFQKTITTNQNNEPITMSLTDQLIPFYKMIEKGIIHIPTRDELLSISDLAIGMKSPPAKNYISSGTNGHKYWYPTATKNELVFDRLDAYWGGTILEDYDFSKYAFNIKQRTTNFIPEMPYGIVPIIPSGVNPDNYFKNVIDTDGEFFYDKSGDKFSASDYKLTVKNAIFDAAARLPVIVNGDVHWSAVKLDNNHIRITLVDPGYLNPIDRKAEIVLQHIQGITCTDILSRNTIPINNAKISINVPAGVFRIVDIKY